jgi:hypothetical protein
MELLHDETDPALAHPYRWAAFVLAGDWQGAAPGRRGWPGLGWLLLAGGAGLAAAALGLGKLRSRSEARAVLDEASNPSGREECERNAPGA